MKKMSRVLLIAAFLFMLQSVSSTSGLEENTGILSFLIDLASAVSSLILNLIYLYSKALNPTAVLHEKLGTLAITESEYF